VSARPFSWPRVASARFIPLILVGLVILVATVGGLLRHRAAARTNHVALASSPKGVTVVRARSETYRAIRRFVGTLDPWVQASVGPQLVSAYVSTVLVRPGAAVAKDQVVATLDCRDPSTRSRSVAMQAEALQAQELALASQAHRVESLLDGGFVAVNEVEQRAAESRSERSRLLAAQAQLVSSRLAVDDCILRAPFAGEVAARFVDPGAFVHPGDAVVSVVDRSVVRLVAYVPEIDFESVAPGAEMRLRLLATGRELRAPIARRSPAADPGTRTVQVEIDLPNDRRELPVNTTAEVFAPVGEPTPATVLPLPAADVVGSRATVFVVMNGRASERALAVVGETGPRLYVDPELGDGALVVVDGRAGLRDGDPVTALERSAREWELAGERADGGVGEAR
jgi:RND family efflux transporter MFP subunit